MKLRVLLIAVALVVVAAVTAALVTRGSTGTVFGLGEPDHAPEGVRIRVQVLNATSTRGLAQRATDLLRDKGYDVVEIGNSREKLDSTLVLDRTNHPDWAQRVAAAMGTTKIELRPDTTRYVDLTILVGATWQPPVQPFKP